MRFIFEFIGNIFGLVWDTFTNPFVRWPLIVAFGVFVVIILGLLGLGIYTGSTIYNQKKQEF